MGEDKVNNPSHYTDGGIETIDFIEAKQLNYRCGNVVKYVARAGKKNDALEDLKKARWYLNREIGAMEDAEKCRMIAEMKHVASRRQKFTAE